MSSGGRTARMLEKALEQVRNGNVVIVAMSQRHADDLRRRVANLTGGSVPERLRFAVAGEELNGYRGYETSEGIRLGALILWDHHAHDVWRSKLSDQIESLRRQLQNAQRALEQHASIEVER